MDSALYTRPYGATDYGAYFLPAHVEWRALPRYVGRSEDGQHEIVDERITLVLQDEPGQFWPVIVKMSIAEAERLREQLGRVIDERRCADEQRE